METNKRVKIGRVVSDKMNKTVVVAVDSRKKHPRYSKSYKFTTKYKSHDARGECMLGDTVKIVESRPLSREKRWRVVEIIGRDVTAGVEIKDETEAIITKNEEQE